MAPCTEVAEIALKPNIDLKDASSEAGKALQQTFKTLTEQPGMQRIAWGTKIEDPSTLVLFIDWDSLDDHQNFMDAPHYEPFRQTIGAYAGAPPALWHMNLSPHPPSAAIGGTDPSTKRPTTEVMRINFPPSIPEAKREAFTTHMAPLSKAVASAKGAMGQSMGWSVESGVPFLQQPIAKRHEEEPGKGRGVAWMGVLGWEDMAAHQAFMESDEFKEKSGLMQEAEDWSEWGLYHVDCEIVPGKGA